MLIIILFTDADLFVAGSVRFLVVQERYRLLAAKEELQRFVYAHNHLAGIQSDCYIPVSVGWEDIDAGADTGRNGHVDWSEFDPDIYSYNIAEPRWIWEKQLILTVFPLQLWKCKKILRINLGFRTSGNGDAPVSAAITDSEKLTREIDREGMRISSTFSIRCAFSAPLIHLSINRTKGEWLLLTLAGIFVDIHTHTHQFSNI